MTAEFGDTVLDLLESRLILSDYQDPLLATQRNWRWNSALLWRFITHGA
jgi:hypothetical protein